MNEGYEGQLRAASDPRAEKVFLALFEEVTSTAGRKYYCQRFLGRGGNGTAFLVTADGGPYAGVQFALKVLHRVSDEKRRDAFTREVAHLKALDHPAIVRMFDEGFLTRASEKHPFVVMEFIPTTLRMVLARRELGRLNAIRAALHCLSALSHIHSQAPAVIHRDIKPENILLSNGTAKLADFGLAKQLVDEEPPPAEAVDDVHDFSQWPGMPTRYRTPELVARARGEKIELTTATDIFQLGTVIYELLTGFNPQRPSETKLDDIVLDLRPIRGESGPNLTALVQDMTNASPHKRPNADECLKRLDGIHRAVCAQLMRLEGLV